MKGSVPNGAYLRADQCSFANPAVTFARAASDAFAGIRLDDVLGFIAAQIAGATVATVVLGWLYPARKS